MSDIAVSVLGSPPVQATITIDNVIQTATIGDSSVQVTIQQGTSGPPGVGVPAGGASGQVLAKNSDVDFDTHWVTGGGGGGAVSSVNSRTGDVVLTATDVGAVPSSKVGVASGVASLDATGRLPSSQVPPVALTDVFVVSSQDAMLALDAQTGDVAVRTDVSQSFMLHGNDPTTPSNWVQLLFPGAVLSVNGYTGVVSLVKSDVGLGNVPNIDATDPANIAQTSSYRFSSDAEKSVWNAKQAALGFTPVPNTLTVNGYPLSSDVTLVASDVGLGNVNNTPDADKPVSTAQAAAISAVTPKIRYSADGASWHDTLAGGDLFYQISANNGTTWTPVLDLYDLGHAGTATLTFGGSPGSNYVTAVVTGQASITTSDLPRVWLDTSAQGSFTAEDVAFLSTLITLSWGSLVAGTGFTISAYSREKIEGSLVVNWRW